MKGESKMYGFKLEVYFEDKRQGKENDVTGILLRPPARTECQLIANGLQSLHVCKYMAMRHAQVLENEEEWYDEQRQNKDDVIWLIVPQGSEVPVGITGIHHFLNPAMRGTLGIVIWDPSLWGKGIATRVHIGTTWYAAKHLGLNTLDATVREANIASRKALEFVGFMPIGFSHFDDFRMGVFQNTNHLEWYNPFREDFLFPDGVPEDFSNGVLTAAELLTKDFVTAP